MRDQEYEAQQKRVEDLLRTWRARLGLYHWRLTYEFFDELSTTNAGGRPAMLETEARWKYQDALIKVYVPSVAEVDDDALERVVVHEFMHVLLNELRPLGDWDDPREHALMHERLAHEEHAAMALADAIRLAVQTAREEALDAPVDTVVESTEVPTMVPPRPLTTVAFTRDWGMVIGQVSDTTGGVDTVVRPEGGRNPGPDQAPTPPVCAACDAWPETAEPEEHRGCPLHIHRLESELSTVSRQLDLITRHLRDHHTLTGCIYARTIGDHCDYIQDVLDGDEEEERANA